MKGDARPHHVFVTGRLAHDALVGELRAVGETPFTWEVVDAGVKVAALLTPKILERRLPGLLDGDVDRFVLPGLFAGETAGLEERFGAPFERGPKDLRDVGAWLGGPEREHDLSGYDPLIFAEIVDAPDLDVDGIVARAAAYTRQGADVIDVGGLPGRPFPHLAESVEALVAAGHRVSIDSRDPDELVRGARAGAEFALSLDEDTLGLLDGTDTTPVLVPREAGDLDSLVRAIDAAEGRGMRYFADPILDPVCMGFTESLVRYHALHGLRPHAPLFMGIGNVTELFEADTLGMNALLMGTVQELGVRAVLTTEVSPHACRAVREADVARRVLFAAARDGGLPKRYTDALMPLHAKRPFPRTASEIEERAALVRDPNYRIEVSPAGIHVYSRDGHAVGTDPFALAPDVDDPSHAFYLGVELARAETAWRLGKRYLQDNPLDWGVADRTREDAP